MWGGGGGRKPSPGSNVHISLEYKADYFLTHLTLIFRLSHRCWNILQLEYYMIQHNSIWRAFSVKPYNRMLSRCATNRYDRFARHLQSFASFVFHETL